MNLPVIQQLELPFERVKKAIDKIIKQHGFETYDTIINAGSNVGDNFMGIVYRIIINGTLSDGTNSELRLFCKLPPQDDIRRKEFRAREAFLKESRVFKEILPQFKKLEEDKGIVEDGFNSFIKCYGTSAIAPEEYILMEDLQIQNFIMFNKSLSIDVEHVKLVMTELGKLHAFSFALRDQKPGIFETYKTLKEHFTNDETNLSIQKYFLSLFDKALETLEDGEDECKQKFSDFRSKFTNFDFYTKGEVAEPYAAVTHGDCWNNNMLFKYEDGKPQTVAFVDWQLTRYSSPVLDLMYYIFCCTDKPLRDEHYEDFLNTYHESLTRFLTRLGSDATKLYPYSVFRQHLMEYGSYGLCMAVLAINIFVSESEDIPDLDDMAKKFNETGQFEGLTNESEKAKGRYKSRMSGVIRDMVRLGYI